MGAEFKGRPVIPGALTGEAVVTTQGLNTLAAFQKSAMSGKKVITCSDQNNPDLHGRILTGKIICLPRTIGSTTGGLVLQTVATLGNGPLALLFSETVDPLAAAGVILARVWDGKTIVTVDGLGETFLRSVRHGDTVEIREDGTVRVLG